MCVRGGDESVCVCVLECEKVCLRFKVCHILFDRKSSQFGLGGEGGLVRGSWSRGSVTKGMVDGESRMPYLL